MVEDVVSKLLSELQGRKFEVRISRTKKTDSASGEQVIYGPARRIPISRGVEYRVSERVLPLRCF
jgi:hypothetical protein